MAIKVKTKIDKFGRIVIPKKIRDDFGLKNNSEVLLEAGEDGIIHPDSTLAFVMDKDRILVVCSEPTESFTSFLKKERENRIKQIAINC
ncbi:MAG: AbrB/MazE/SpoVT family DNA-binding domain-containing protein [Actinobacteria bacterium]|nr:AbrB/MazE/SpoVT family DNA-binding domain-containing protein [Cyanobacteriota bacterium]MCL5772513.1 AbrB/MazE/SpoVT family DNA-binding domain-containing protein [Actinomycetota bacterium]